MSLDVYLLDPTATYNTQPLYWGNITHNLNVMAEHAGLYEPLWRPEDIGGKFAKDIIQYVEKGLADLKARPEHYKQYDSPNGWGTYEQFVMFIEEYLEALKNFPKAKLEISR